MLNNGAKIMDSQGPKCLLKCLDLTTAMVNRLKSLTNKM